LISKLEKGGKHLSTEERNKIMKVRVVPGRLGFNREEIGMGCPFLERLAAGRR
jgi:hypothetical protein